jgi:hypothetical protein
VYSVTVTVNGVTSAAGSTTLVVKEAGTLSATSVDVTCEGAKDGKINAGITGGTATGAYTFKIVGDVFGTTKTNNDGAFTGVNGDTYTVSAVSADGCVAAPVPGVTVKGPSAMIRTVVSNVVNATCAVPVGSFTVSQATTNTATGPFTYNYSNTGVPATFLDNNGIFNGVPAGTYTIYAKDAASGCIQGYKNSKVVIKAPVAIASLTPTVTPIVCNGGTATVKLVVKGGKAPYTFNFNGSSNATGSFKPVAAGSYSYSVSDVNGCTFDGAGIISITNPDVLTIATPLLHPTTKTSADGSITINAAGGVGGYSYKLNAAPNNVYGTNNVFSSLKAGNYTAYVKDAGGCVKTAAVKLIAGAGSSPALLSLLPLETETELTASVSPNPTTNAFVLHLSGKSSEAVAVRVIDLYGRVVYSTKGSGSQTYTFGGQFASGLYLIEVQQGGKPVKTIKAVKAQ